MKIHQRETMTTHGHKNKDITQNELKRIPKYKYANIKYVKQTN